MVVQERDNTKMSKIVSCVICSTVIKEITNFKTWLINCC